MAAQCRGGLTRRKWNGRPCFIGVNQWGAHAYRRRGTVCGAVCLGFGRIMGAVLVRFGHGRRFGFIVARTLERHKTGAAAARWTSSKTWKKRGKSLILLIFGNDHNASRVSGAKHPLEKSITPLRILEKKNLRQKNAQTSRAKRIISATAKILGKFSHILLNSGGITVVFLNF